MSSVSHLHKLACDLAFRCTSADLLRCYVLSLCVNFGAYLIYGSIVQYIMIALEYMYRYRYSIDQIRSEIHTRYYM